MSGEWQQAPENTLQSLKHGIIHSDGVEFDLRLTSDGKLIIHHDSVVSIPKHELEDLKLVVKKEMENAYNLQVPLVVDLGSGKSWLEAH